MSDLPGRAAPRRSSGPVDQSQMRLANMSLLLRRLRTGGRSRATLAAETGLSKAATSSLVAELAKWGLVKEGRPDRVGAVGRPGVTVAIDGRHVAGVGVEINVDYVAVTAVDLSGVVVRQVITPIAAASSPADVVLSRTAQTVAEVLDSLVQQEMRVVAITVSPPGVIDYAAGAVLFSANLGWRQVPIVAELQARLGADVPPIHLENDAKLAAVAEYVTRGEDGVSDLVFLTGDVGVGAGIIADGRLVRGWSGFSGEVGHLPFGPAGRPCPCGRTGCWETGVGLDAFLRLAAADDDPVRDPVLPLADRLEVLQRRAVAGDARVVDALADVGVLLARGLSALIDVLNPRVIVLGGYFGFFADQLLTPLADELAARRMDAGSEVILAAARLGLASAAHGGALLALEDVFTDPSVVAPSV